MCGCEYLKSILMQGSLVFDMDRTVSRLVSACLCVWSSGSCAAVSLLEAILMLGSLVFAITRKV